MNQLYITRIILKNFRVHEHLDLELKDLNILVGENGGGKTSVLEGICYALCGAVASCAKKTELIKHGKKNGSVTLYFSNGYKIIKDLASSTKLLDENDKIVSEKAGEVEAYLNIDKDVFLNVLYASQNDIYSYFMKFNAKEKDFLDKIFNLDELTDKISLLLKNNVVELNMQYNNIESSYNVRTNLEQSISNILQSYGMSSIMDLERAVEIAKENFQILSQKNALFQQRETILKNLEISRTTLININKRIEQLENSLKHGNEEISVAKKDFKSYIEKVEKDLNVQIDVSNLTPLFDMFDNNTSISTHLYQIKSYSQTGLSNIDNKVQVAECFKAISSEVDIIGMLDQYRTYYNQIRTNINNLIRKIETAVNNLAIRTNDLENEKHELDLTVIQIRELEKQLKNMSSLDIDNVEQFTNMAMKNQAQYTQLQTTLDNVKMYQNQLLSLGSNNPDDDLKRLNDITNTIKSIEKIAPIFSRDGFVSYLRKSLLKDIATNIGDSLEKFGFIKLTPVTIDEKNGALLFHERAFRSLSGGEKTIVAILLRILWAKLLSTNLLPVLLLDEPTADLDSVRVSYLRQLLTKINKALHLQIICVTHDSELIPEKANRISIGG